MLEACSLFTIVIGDLFNHCDLDLGDPCFASFLFTGTLNLPSCGPHIDYCFPCPFFSL
jgi:hypothetical protein